MSSGDYEIFWNESLKQLIKNGEITEEESELWLQRISFVRAEGQTFFVMVPSRFYQDQLEQRYVKMIKNKLSDLIGVEISISFIIQSILKTDLKQDKVAPVFSKETRPQTPIKKHPQLRDDYTFDRYVEGNNNSFAVNAAKVISENPGRQYNPFLIYGGVGLGKTHLMQAIGNYMYMIMPEKKIVYIPAETFVSEFIHAIRTKKTIEFKNKYRKSDVLLIDDIHDLHSKRDCQEELFHTFNAIYDAKKQLVFTCDRPPSELKNFNLRLKSRFEVGLNVDIQPPSFETRMAIINKKLENSNSNLPDDVIEFIAQNLTTNIRDIESALTKLVAYGELVSKKITLDIAKQQIKGNYINLPNSNITISRVQKVVAEYFNLTTSDMKSKKKTKAIYFPRQIAMYIIREISDFSTTEIGLEFGGRDHTTVMHACQKIEDSMKSDATLEPLISNLIRSIKDPKS